MGFFKSLFGGADESPEEKKEREAARDFDVLKTNGLQALRTGHADYAVQSFSRALELKDDLEVHDYLSQAFAQAGQYQQAIEQLEILAEAQPDNIHILAAMAKVNYLMEDYNAMAATCEKAMLIDKDNAEVMLLYARAARGRGDMVNAVAMYTKTLMLNANFDTAHLERGELLLAMGDIEGAEEDADHLMEVAAGAEDVLLLKGQVLMAQQQPAEAIALFDRAIAINPYCTAAFKERGAARLALGDKEGAEKDFQQLLELDPEAFKDLNGSFVAEGKD